ncbi:hypothetical protein SEVIR_6G205700v4 [Setaria viridis]|uniref:DUF1618 domain-containing protein n=1 Tax=Setaria viridis TaxID=4556 RepID=A0A4U6U8U5_SETVI|nr:uncharacterized protein LOC117860369 [Setaria viridis]TKW11005.1 hypothetical protein SEVIR_6G205700v2 [Setaria viridis]
MRFPARYAWLAAAAAAGGGGAELAVASPTKTHFLPTRRHSSAAAATTEPPQMAPTADGPTPPGTSPWVILGSIPRVAPPGGVGADDEAGADVSLALAAPPRVSRLAVSEHVFPDRPTPQSFPFVLAADRSGLLLLSAILSTPPRRVVIDRPGHQSVHWEDTDPRYYVLDAATGAASRLPDPAPQETIEHQALVGLVACPGAAGGGGGFMVAELLPLIGSDKAHLRCYSSDVGEWVDKRVRYPLPPRPLAPICTISHQGKLWWADYSWGIITADPFADDPVLRFVPLPPGCVLQCREAWGVLDEFRYLGVSAGRLRFVDTYRRRGDPTKVTVWTLPDADAREWKLEHEATFADIWADDSYKATGLPKEPPVLALIHPHNPAVVYFFLEGHLFAVDVSVRKVVDCDRYNLVAPPQYYPISNRFIRAWELPRAISSDPGNWSTDISSSQEPTEAPPTREVPSPGDYHLVGNTRQTFIG